jgi:ABC-type Na+ transport system ATPase subunit NatA
MYKPHADQSFGAGAYSFRYFGLAITTYGAFFALYPTWERHQKIRALYYSNGLRALPLWLAYTAFDFSFVLFVSGVTTIVLSVVFAHWYLLGYFFVVLALYGLTSLLFSYVVSLFAKSQLAAFAVVAGSQAITYLVYIIAFLSISTNSSRASLDSSIRLAHYLLSVILPAGSLARGVLVSLNLLSVTCRGTALIPYPGDVNAYGGPILYLIVQSGLLFGFLVWWDFGPRINVSSKKSGPYAEDQELEDIDVLSEVHRSIESDDPLRVIHASKSFGGESVLDDVTFGVGQSEVFALLGPNGAGKTTLMALIRGEMVMSDKRGEIFVQGISLKKNLTSLRTYLGFCPQFDAIDIMTVAEHLRLYAKFHGVDDIDGNVQQILTAMGLAQFEHRRASQLSGGYKRRLSLGMALIGNFPLSIVIRNSANAHVKGNPDVLLLDEPSSGLDVVGKREMWQTIKAVSPGRSIAFTVSLPTVTPYPRSETNLLSPLSRRTRWKRPMLWRTGQGFWISKCSLSAPSINFANDTATAIPSTWSAEQRPTPLSRK